MDHAEPQRSGRARPPEAHDEMDRRPALVEAGGFGSAELIGRGGEQQDRGDPAVAELERHDVQQSPASTERRLKRCRKGGKGGPDEEIGQGEQQGVRATARGSMAILSIRAWSRIIGAADGSIIATIISDHIDETPATDSPPTTARAHHGHMIVGHGRDLGPSRARPRPARRASTSATAEISTSRDSSRPQGPPALQRCGLSAPASGRHLFPVMCSLANWACESLSSIVDRPLGRRPAPPDLGNVIFEAFGQVDSGAMLLAGDRIDDRLAARVDQPGTLELRAAGSSMSRSRSIGANTGSWTFS